MIGLGLHRIRFFIQEEDKSDYPFVLPYLETHGKRIVEILEMFRKHRDVEFLHNKKSILS